jgi:type IV secretory pathway VirB10-like protein
LSEHTLSQLRADAQLTPVITVRSGTVFQVLVARDLVFDAPY